MALITDVLKDAVVHRGENVRLTAGTTCENLFVDAKLVKISGNVTVANRATIIGLCVPNEIKNIQARKVTVFHSEEQALKALSDPAESGLIQSREDLWEILIQYLMYTESHLYLPTIILLVHIQNNQSLLDHDNCRQVLQRAIEKTSDNKVLKDRILEACPDLLTKPIHQQSQAKVVTGVSLESVAENDLVDQARRLGEGLFEQLNQVSNLGFNVNLLMDLIIEKDFGKQYRAVEASLKAGASDAKTKDKFLHLCYLVVFANKIDEVGKTKIEVCESAVRYGCENKTIKNLLATLYNEEAVEGINKKIRMTNDQIISHLERSIELNPEYIQPLFNLATALIQKGMTKGNLQKAISLLERAVALDPQGNMPNLKMELQGVKQSYQTMQLFLPQ